MATAALSYLLQKGFDGLGSLIKNEFELIKDLEKDIESLRSTLSAILAVVGDTEKKQLKSTTLKDWIAKLKHAAYDVDDVLDEFKSEASRRELESHDPLTKKMRNYVSISTSHPVLFPSYIARKVKDVRKRLSAIAEERSNFHLIAGAAEIFDTNGMETTDSWVIESEVSGRDEEKRSLVEALLDVGREEELSVIPIVGMGGIGKTTLAQLVYNDARVTAHFDVRIWVCVSDDFDVKRVIKAIIDSPAIEKCNSEELDALQCHLRQQLWGKKFLLVLDDVWEEQPWKWDRLRSYLQSGAACSKIIVTTRSAKVSSLMGTLPPHHLRKLSDDDCWKLFKQRAFGQGQEENPNLVAFGKEIVKKCGGVPLAAKALGSMMLFRTSEREWEVIKDDEIWNLPEENGILPALRLSYYNLSPQLKQCFAYCSIFPKDHQIKTRELILMWMGEGFIQPTQGRQEMEDTGRELFKNLLWRSFFQEPVEDGEGNIVSCKMHDLMHDLAVSISGEVCSIVKEGDMTSIPNECRHLSLVSSSRHYIELTQLNRVEKVRTLLTFGPRLRSITSFDISIRLPHLRVLQVTLFFLREEDIESLVNSVSGLKQLKYLCLRFFGMRYSLPESLCKLHNLQTLRLMDYRGLIELPRDMRRMTSLRHLDIDDQSRWTRMPPKMGELKFLQTLRLFIVGEEESGCNIRELQELNLGGQLRLRKLENVRGRENAAEARLNEKANLRSLIFSWSQDDIDDSMRSISEHTLEGLKPHKNLKRLLVLGYGGERCPHWMSNPLVLQNLTSLNLINCESCKELPSLGQLPLLKSLYVVGMNAVKCIGSHFYGERAFPSLGMLSLRNMSNLEEWMSSAELNHRQPQAFPRLQQLDIYNCPKLTAIPTCFPSLSSLDLQMFQVDSLPVDLFQNKTRLSTVSLYCEKLKSLPRNLGNLDALHTLWISSCSDLTSLRLEGGFTSLQNLTISYCDSLESFVGETHDLTPSKSLNIESCPQLGSLPEGTKHLTALRSLSISNCPRVACLPDCLKHARMLERLSISNLKNFAALPEWIHNFSSLQKLEINSCENLVALPSGLQHLTNLKYLEIKNCPRLKTRCKEHIGEDWDKIAHIPDRSILEESDEIWRYGYASQDPKYLGTWLYSKHRNATRY